MILPRALSLKLQKVIPTLIPPDEQGYIRYITLDEFQKAFDAVERFFIPRKCLSLEKMLFYRSICNSVTVQLVADES